MEPKIITESDTLSSAGPWRTIILTGLLAGTLDAVAAIVVSQASPAAVFKYIASGAFGAGKAFSGGDIMIAWGVIFHYFIALSWTLLFFFIYPTLPWLKKNKYVAGLLYGIFVWVMMNRVVIPLSEIPQRPFNLKGALTGMSILMVAIGLPISILTHRYYLRKGIV
ncbi:MAG TPA: hypothetical protein VFG46_12425 [Chryseolinea sp.]|nr:hypothetical protein [Chryseolinea sp.]